MRLRPSTYTQKRGSLAIFFILFYFFVSVLFFVLCLPPPPPISILLLALHFWSVARQLWQKKRTARRQIVLRGGRVRRWPSAAVSLSLVLWKGRGERERDFYRVVYSIGHCGNKIIKMVDGWPSISKNGRKIPFSVSYLGSDSLLYKWILHGCDFFFFSIPQRIASMQLLCSDGVFFSGGKNIFC